MFDIFTMNWLERVLFLKRVVGSGGWISPDFETDPYHYRKSPNIGHDYNREYDEIVGASVGWNQLCDTADTSVTVPNGHKYIARRSGSWSVGTSNGTALTVDGSNNDMVIDLTLALGSAIADYIVTQGNTSGVDFFRKYFPNDYYAYDIGSIQSVSGLVSHDTVGKNLRGGIDFANDIKIRIPSLSIDTDAKTASFDYNAGTVSGVYAPNVDFKENTRYTFILTLKNTSVARSNLRIYYTDNTYTDLPDLSGVNVKETLAIATSANKTVLTITRRTQGGTTVLYYDECGVFEGVLTATDFVPYQKHSYALDSTVTLRGKFNLVDGKLKADGDRYPPSGEGTRKYAEISLGDLSWTYVSARSMFRATPSVAYKPTETTDVPNLVCSKYVSASLNGFLNNSPNMAIAVGTTGAYAGNFCIRDTAYTDKDAFKQMLTDNNVKLVYDIAMPTPFSATPYTNPQACDSSGTEEYVSTSIVPIGHQTKYAQK